MILLTGASGSVGIETLKTLLDQSKTVRVFDLKTARSEKQLRPYADRVDIFWGDIRRPKDVRTAVEGVQAVIHLAAVIPPLADTQPDLAQAVNVQGTRNLLAALQNRSDAVRFVYASSISVYGDRLQDPWIRVEDPIKPSPGDHYGQTKVLGEEAVQDSGLDWTILRLSAVVNRGFVHRKLDRILFHVPLDTQIEWVDSADVARALVHALEQGKTVGRILNLGGGARCRTTYREFLDTVFEINGLGRGLLPSGAFAHNSFHCGYYTDSQTTEELLCFQRRSLDDLYYDFQAQVSRFQRFFARLFRPLIRRYLLTLSDPYQKYRTEQPQPADVSASQYGQSSGSPSKTVLITGASGGLGLAMTRYLCQIGFHVFAAYHRRPLPLDELGAATDRITAIQLDVTDPVSVEQAFKAISRMTDGLDAIINNAGVYTMSSILEGEQNDFDRIMAVNVLGTQRVTRTFFPLLLARRGRVITMSSEKAQTALPFDLYGLSKQWLESYTQVLRRELSLLGLKAIIVRPGSHDTGLLESIKHPSPELRQGALGRAFRRMQILAQKLLPAPKDPLDVARQIYRILMARYPRRCYTVNGSPIVRLLGAMPVSAVDRLIRYLLVQKGIFHWAVKPG